mmetsp:Transcript_38487/g.36847  ORF Transcript_38487/g.36847 Transcript_38487/m.36847 type:complete len:307 (-) Transcript_38487:30-950(-)
MKCIKKEEIALTQQEAKAKAERKILEQVDHPFIVKLHYAFQTPQKLYYVMDFLNGGELFTHLRREGKFSEDRARFYAAEILAALHCLHEHGIIYRDLKPENVLLDQDGHLKLTDFGLSKLGLHGNKTTYTFCGTPEYLAPEIIVNKGHTKAVDWWSLGMLLYEMLSGVNPVKQKLKNKFDNMDVVKKLDIPMLPIFTEHATSLLKGLLDKKPKNRLGYSGGKEIMNHPFFEKINWEELLSKKTVPPYKPRLQSIIDLSNIDQAFTMELPEESFEREEKYLIGDEKFEDFTYLEDGSRKGSRIDTST